MRCSVRVVFSSFCVRSSRTARGGRKPGITEWQISSIDRTPALIQSRWCKGALLAEMSGL